MEGRFEGENVIVMVDGWVWSAPNLDRRHSR